MNKIFFPLIYLVITIVVALSALAAVVNKISEKDQPLVNLPTNSGNQQLVACTMEAKLCLDGSSVGRTGPNCEFALCPNSKTNQTAGWKTYKNSEYGFEFKYPLDWDFESDIQLKDRYNISIYKTTSSSAYCISGNNCSDLPNATEYFYVEVIPINSSDIDKTLSEIVNKWLVAGKKSPSNIIGQWYRKLTPILEPIKIGGRDGLKTDFSTNQFMYFVMKDSRIYTLSNVPVPSHYPNILEKIISTFKFTNQTPQQNQNVDTKNGVCGPCGDFCIDHAEAASCPVLDGSFKCERINAVCTKVLLSN